MKMHARKISDALTGMVSREGSPTEMRSLMDPSKGNARQQAEGKMSGESLGSGDEVDGVVGEGGNVVAKI